MTLRVYRFVLEEAAFESFAGLSAEDQELAQSFFRWLARNPALPGQDSYKDATGRVNQVSLCGPFLIAHWTDDAAAEVRIVQLRQD